MSTGVGLEGGDTYEDSDGDKWTLMDIYFMTTLLENTSGGK